MILNRHPSKYAGEWAGNHLGCKNLFVRGLIKCNDIGLGGKVCSNNALSTFSFSQRLRSDKLLVGAGAGSDIQLFSVNLFND